MDKINELLTTIETNLNKLGKQHKSGQAVLIVDALIALAGVRHLTSKTNPTLKDRANIKCDICEGNHFHTGCPNK